MQGCTCRDVQAGMYKQDVHAIKDVHAGMYTQLQIALSVM